jgi:hypothetical protein
MIRMKPKIMKTRRSKTDVKFWKRMCIMKKIENITSVYKAWKASDAAFIKALEWSINNLVVIFYCQSTTSAFAAESPNYVTLQIITESNSNSQWHETFSI